MSVSHAVTSQGQRAYEIKVTFDGWMDEYKRQAFLVHAKMSFKLDSKVGREENPKVSREQ